MRPLIIRGNVWRVVRVNPGDPFLIDKTGTLRIATTDPTTKTIRISKTVLPPMFDQVYLHEISHAIMSETPLFDSLNNGVPYPTEELLAWFLEMHAIEAIDIASRSLGRPLCIDGKCLGGT